MAEAELATIARPYARAAFSVALEQDALTDWSFVLALLAGAARGRGRCNALRRSKILRTRISRVFSLHVC